MHYILIKYWAKNAKICKNKFREKVREEKVFFIHAVSK